MDKYHFTVEQVEVDCSKLSLEVSVTGEFDTGVKNPRIAVIFDNGNQTRRLPILVCSYDKLEDGSFYLYAKYTYDLKNLFWDEIYNQKITLYFALLYGDEEYAHKPFVLGSEEQMKKKVEKTATGRQKPGKDLPYRVAYSEDMTEIILVSDMTVYREGTIKKVFKGIGRFLYGVWTAMELLMSILLIPVFMIEALFSLADCAPRKDAIEEDGIIYLLKHIRWKMDNFTGLRIGFYGTKLWGMYFMNWLGRHSPVKKNYVTFLSNRRNDLTGNFEFVYNELKKNPNVQFRFVLSEKETKQIAFKDFLRIGYYFGCSRVILIDDFLELLFMMKRRRGTYLIQLWHACGAFKTFGYTRLGKEGGQRQDSPNHRNYDFTTVSSQEISRFYAEGFGLSLEKVAATGVPRTDIFFDKLYGEKIAEKFYEQYPKLRDKKILLFAPTFRGNGKNSGFYPVEQFDVNTLYEQLNEEYAIIIKHHPFTKERHKIKKKHADYIIDMSSNSELNDLLFITDLLITDYSSVIFEASLLDIPMLFYAYDLQQYVATRGFYYEFETFVPGKIVDDFTEIAPAILAGDFHQEKIDPFKKRFFDSLDGKSSERTAKLVYDCMDGTAKA